MNQDQFLSAVRAALTIGGTIFAAKGKTDSATWETITGAVLAIAGVAWSQWHHSDGQLEKRLLDAARAPDNVAQLPKADGGPGSAGKLIPIALLLGVLACGCQTNRLETGGAYAPVGTNTVANTTAMGFFVVESSFDLAYATVDGALKFERDNRALLWAASPSIKHTLDGIRPQALDAARAYARARTAYLANPTPAGLTNLQQLLAVMQQLAASAAAALPKGN